MSSQSAERGRKSRFAPKRSDGLMAYVVSTSSWGRTTEQIEWAGSLKDAKDKWGWTRQPHTTKRVRRATVIDLESCAFCSHIHVGENYCNARAIDGGPCVCTVEQISTSPGEGLSS